ncbi:MAG: hypothetical protein JWN31_1935 [Frankiales bacterium]|nr:hypothetical protein [Frankiales bacterium]
MTSPPPGNDDAFDQIVAGFGKESDDPVPRWPVSEDVSPDAPPAVGPSAPSRDLPAPEVEPLPGWLEPDSLEDDGHFEPPPPPRLPRPHVRTVVATGMLLLGLVVMFAPFRIGLDDSTTFLLLGLALTIGGAGLLIYWMRDTPDADSRPDDGAVV